jgi:YegS/Rv2252/BmrU family lipid kinase
MDPKATESQPPRNGADPASALSTKAELDDRIKSERSAVLLVNIRSRRGRDLFDSSRRLLAREGYAIRAAFPIEDGEQLQTAVEDAIALRPSLLIVGSGDGTVGTVVDHLAYKDIALGLLPLGTTNNFARNLGLRLSLRDAIRVIARGKVVDVDLGQVDDNYFGNALAVGLTVEIAGRVSHRLKRVVGQSAYVLAGARAFAGHMPFRATVVTPGARHEYHTHQLVVANGGFHGGRRIAHGATIDDRRLTIFPLGDHRRSRLVTDLAAYHYGRRRHAGGGPFIATDRATILAEPPRAVEVDGEIQAVTPIEVKVAHNALRVMAPVSFADL